MTREEAITRYKAIKTRKDFCEYLNEDMVEVAIQALENISHLKDRPCEACEFKKGTGCCKWDCVFD